MTQDSYRAGDLLCEEIGKTDQSLKIFSSYKMLLQFDMSASSILLIILRRLARSLFFLSYFATINQRTEFYNDKEMSGL